MADRLDLTQLRVLAVGGKSHAVGILRTVLGVLGIRAITAEADSRRALEMLRSEAFDVVFCDEHAGPVDGLAFPLAARRAPGVLNPMLPVFQVFGAPRRREVECARDDGVTDVVTRPLSAATVARKIRAAIAAPRPFIAASQFFGPDRRSAVREGHEGSERRTRATRKVRLPAQPKTDTVLI